MRAFGTPEAGFSLEQDGDTVRLETWGFWDAELCATFGRVAIDACRQRPTQLVLDVSRLKPLRDEGQEAMRGLMAAARNAAIGRTMAVVGGNMLTKMQFMRLAKEAGARGWAYVASEAATL